MAFVSHGFAQKSGGWFNSMSSEGGCNQFVWYAAGLGASLVAAAAYFVYTRINYTCEKVQIVPLIDLNSQSEAVEPGKSSNWRRSKLLKTNELPLRTLHAGIVTIYDALRRGLEMAGADGPCLGWRTAPSSSSGNADATSPAYQWMSYGEVVRRSQHLAVGMLKLGLAPGKSSSGTNVEGKSGTTSPKKLTCIGIYAKNRPEWAITEQSCYCYNMTLVPLYDTLGADACRYICDQAVIELCVCDSIERLEQLVDMKAKGCATLRVLVIMDDYTIKTFDEDTADEETLTVVREKRKRYQKLVAEYAEKPSSSLQIYTLRQVEALGAAEQSPPPHVKLTAHDVCTICHTSGTTGLPKGVILTHENVISAVSAVSFQLGTEAPRRSDCLMSFLPLAHMLQRLSEIAYLMQGGRIGYYSGDIRNLADDMIALKPTCCAAVPRLLNRIHDEVYSRVQGSMLKRCLLALALRAKARQIRKGIIRRDTIWDKLVFARIQQRMGGSLRLLLTGASPLDGTVLQFIRCALGCVVVEGYGQTECSSPCTLTLYGDWEAGHVGPPIPCNTVKLMDVPDMNISVERDGVGEVCIQGTNVFQGYYGGAEAEALTREVLDADGFLHTGDVGKWTERGTLCIVDRCKHMFKLSQGEYIVPDKIEALYQRHLLVNQAFLYGEPLESVCVALLVVEEKPLRTVLRKLTPADEGVLQNLGTVNARDGGINDLHYMANKCTFDELCDDRRIAAVVLERLNRFVRLQGLMSFELAKCAKLLKEPFSVENGLLSPTMKVKRHDVRSRYKSELAELYADIKRQEQRQKTAKK